jgi:hypothetical protein
MQALIRMTGVPARPLRPKAISVPGARHGLPAAQRWPYGRHRPHICRIRFPDSPGSSEALETKGLILVGFQCNHEGVSRGDAAVAVLP